ncbi:MAG: SpoIIE family protein phosphatase [Hydrogeniiclostridium mannosilyticum]
MSQIRALAAEQFGMASRILEDLSGDLELFERIDTISAQKITEILRTLQINPLHVNCCIDSFGRLRVEAELTPQEKGLLDRPFVAKEASRACGRTFDLPVLTAARGNYRLAMAERPAFRIRTGYAQHICGNGKFCGDSCECFSDGSGRQIALISDGMGNGGRAAVDAAMAGGLTARLLQTGIGADACLKIVNSALLVKAETNPGHSRPRAHRPLPGHNRIYKAGSPLSVLRTNGHTSVIDTPSLPIGILNETHFSKSSATVDGEGLLVLMSDGALAAGEDWVIDAVDQFQGQLPQELAEELVGGAISRRDDGHDDDITVLVAAIEPLRERSSP